MKKIRYDKTFFFCTIILNLLIFSGLASPAWSSDSNAVSKKNAAAKMQRILFVASYNTQNPWSGGIKSGILSVLKSRKDVELLVFDMDTMGVQSEMTKIQAALKARQEIETYQPDVVITSDDNAAKYLIAAHYKNSSLPFVFCGVNWDASKYGLPSKNVTGMIEVQLIDQLVAYLSPYARGNRIGSLRGDTMTNRAEAVHFERQLNTEIKTYFVKDISDWKKKFVQLQKEVDMVLLGDIDTVELNGESKADVEEFIFMNTEVPTGHWDSWFSKNALITLATIPEEQGEYAATAALEILDGKSPAEMPLVKNKKAKVYLNMKLAKKLGVIFPMDLIESAEIISAN